jgi:hypothetical protein
MDDKEKEIRTFLVDRLRRRRARAQRRKDAKQIKAGIAAGISERNPDMRPSEARKIAARIWESMKARAKADAEQKARDEADRNRFLEEINGRDW